MESADYTEQLIKLLNEGRIEEAIEYGEKIVKAYPDAADAFHMLGIAYAQMGKFPQCIKNICCAINIDPNNYLYHSNLSNAYVKIFNRKNAYLHLYEALRLNPNYAEGFNNLASMYYREGQLEKATENYEKAARMNPANWEVHYNLGNCYFKLNRLESAIEQYENTIRIKEDHADARQNLGMCYVAINEFVKALPFVAEVAANNPQHKEIQHQYAECLLANGGIPEAIEQYEIAYKLDPENPSITHNLGVLYLRKNDKDKALEYFDKTIELQPDNDTAKHMHVALSGETTQHAPPEYVEQLFDQYAPVYNAQMQEQLKYDAPTKMREEFNKQIKSKLKSMHILDLGCGTGLCCPLFSDMSAYMVGVDISYGMLQEANKLGGYDLLLQANIVDGLPFKSSKFDLALAADVFVYFGDLNPLLNYLKRAITNEGYIIFTVENCLDAAFKLNPTGRYAHSEEYIKETCNSLKLAIKSVTDITPRYQQQEPIEGKLYIIQVRKQAA